MNFVALCISSALLLLSVAGCGAAKSEPASANAPRGAAVDGARDVRDVQDAQDAQPTEREPAPDHEDVSAAERDEPTTPEAPEVLAPEQYAALTPAQREVLAPEFLRYGSGWTLSEVEKAFAVMAAEIPNGYELLFVAQGHSGLHERKRIEIGGSFTGGGLELPEAPELTAQQSRRAAAALRRTRELWIIGNNSECTLLDVRSGLASLEGQGTLQTRFHDGHAVLAVTGDAHLDPLVIVIDLRTQRVVEARAHSLPPITDRRMLQPDEVRFIDRALRQHGSFGVYGDVSQGLRAIVSDSRVRIAREDAVYSVSVSSHDGHGHHLSFWIDRRTGVIQNMSAGHAIPARALE